MAIQMYHIYSDINFSAVGEGFSTIEHLLLELLKYGHSIIWAAKIRGKLISGRMSCVFLIPHENNSLKPAR